MSAPEPFGGPRYYENRALVRAPAEPCGYCGKAIAPPWKDAVRVHDHGRGKTFVPANAPDGGGGELGCWPVGADCARRLRKAGVPVFAWGGEDGQLQPPGQDDADHR